MKCFTITHHGVVVPNIVVTTSPYPHIGVGEKSNGLETGDEYRFYVQLPVARSYFRKLKKGQNGDVVEKGDIIYSRRGIPILVEEKVPDERALVLVNICAGFQGYLEITSALQEAEPCPKRDKLVPENSGEWWAETESCGWCGERLEKTERDGQVYIYHPSAGVYYPYLPFPDQFTRVLMKGRCAYGITGAEGGHSVWLLIMEPGACFRVERKGRLYGTPSELQVFWDGENMNLNK